MFLHDFGVPNLTAKLGRFHLRFALRDRPTGRLLHLLDDALQLVVYPPGDERGAVLLEGRWALKEIGAPVELLPDERAHLS